MSTDDQTPGAPDDQTPGDDIPRDDLIPTEDQAVTSETGDDDDASDGDVSADDDMWVGGEDTSDDLAADELDGEVAATGLTAAPSAYEDVPDDAPVDTAAGVGATAGATADDQPPAEEAPSGPPAVAKVLAGIAVLAVAVGLVFAVLGARTPPAYTFDGEAVSREEAAERIDGLQPGLGDVILDPDAAAPEQLAQAREQLNFEIVYELLQKAAAERDIEITEEDLVAGVREFLAPDVEADDADAVFAAAAESTGATEDRIRRETEANLIYQALVESADLDEPSDEDIAEAFESGQFPDLSSPGLNIIQSQSEEEVQAAYERLEAGEEFAAVAADVDPTYSGPQRGFDPQFLPDSMQEAVGALEPGGYTEPIDLADAGAEGFAILQVVDPPSLDEATPTIVQALTSQAEQSFLSDLIAETEEASEITVDPVFGEWVNGQGIVPPEAQTQQLPPPVQPDAPAVEEAPAAGDGETPAPDASEGEGR